MFRASLFLALLALAAPASGQIVTDRPDLTESTAAVPTLQIETGVQVARTSGSGGSAEITGPNALVRIGVAPGLEARLGLPNYISVSDDLDGDATGFSDPSLGVKGEVGTLAGWDLAAIAEVSLPLGDDPFSTPISPLGILVAGRDLGAVSLGSQVEVRWNRAAEHVDVGGTAVVGVPLGERVGVFAEAAATRTVGGAEVLAQCGATLLLSPNVQLDAFGGAGLTRLAPDVFGGMGLSARF